MYVKSAIEKLAQATKELSETPEKRKDDRDRIREETQQVTWTKKE